MNTIFKKLVWATVTIILCSLHSNAQVVSQKVGNNPTIIEPSAALEIESTSKAVLLPRVTNTAAVTTPVNGMIVYDISSNCVKAYENGAWTGCLSEGTSSSAVVTIDCANSSFSCAPKYVGTTGITVSFSIINNSFTTVSAVDFSNAVTLSGAGAAGLTVTAGQNSSVTINSGATATLTYNLTGAPTTAGTLTAAFTKLGLSCTANSMVYGANGIGNGLNGTTAANANLSCNAIKQAFPSSADGVYWIDPDLSCTTISAMQVQCDMTTAGGGWTKIAAGGDGSTGTFSQTTSISNLTDGGYWPDAVAFKFGEMSISAIRITQASTFANANLRNWDLGDAIFTGTNVANWLKSTGTVPVTNLAAGWTGRFWNTFLFDGYANVHNFRYPSLFKSLSNSMPPALCGNVWRMDLFDPSVNACSLVNSNYIWSTNLAGASYTCSTPVIKGVRVYWVK